MMRSKEVRVAPPDGKVPILLAFGPAREDNTLRAGLLFVSAELDAGVYHLFDPSNPKERVAVRLPAELVDLPHDKHIVNARLETARE